MVHFVPAKVCGHPQAEGRSTLLWGDTGPVQAVPNLWLAQCGLYHTPGCMECGISAAEFCTWAAESGGFPLSPYRHSGASVSEKKHD